jgi:acyl-coenzyme A synthetase/AMP-(fatty) acid ligase
VGEPINPEAWLWYHRVVGGQQCSIVDTYWQTETGGHLLTPLPGAVQTKPGSACLPFFGVEPEILDEVGKCLQIFLISVTEKHRVKRDKIVENGNQKILIFAQM